MSMHAAGLTHSIFISPSPPRLQDTFLLYRSQRAENNIAQLFLQLGSWVQLRICHWHTCSWDMEIESEVEISYYPFTLLPIGKQVEKLDSFFRAVLQYPFSNSLDVERQLQWTQQLNPKFQCPVTSCVKCQEAAQAATTVTETFKLLVWNTWIRFLNSIIPMASSEVIVSLLGTFWELFVETWFLLKIPRVVSVFWNLIQTLTKQVMTYRGRSTSKWVVLVQKLANC